MKQPFCKIDSFLCADVTGLTKINADKCNYAFINKKAIGLIPMAFLRFDNSYDEIMLK